MDQSGLFIYSGRPGGKPILPSFVADNFHYFIQLYGKLVGHPDMQHVDHIGLLDHLAGLLTDAYAAEDDMYAYLKKIRYLSSLPEAVEKIRLGFNQRVKSSMVGESILYPLKGAIYQYLRDGKSDDLLFLLPKYLENSAVNSLQRAIDSAIGRKYERFVGRDKELDDTVAGEEDVVLHPSKLNPTIIRLIESFRPKSGQSFSKDSIYESVIKAMGGMPASEDERRAWEAEFASMWELVKDFDTIADFKQEVMDYINKAF